MFPHGFIFPNQQKSNRIKMLLNVLSFICLAIITNAAVVKKNEPKVIRMDVKQGVSNLVKRGDATGTSGLTQNYYAFTHLEVGSNKELTEVIIDTGSWLTHIFDVNITCSGCQGTSEYNSSQSSTVVKLGKKGQSFFGPDAYYIGELVSDSIQIGDLTIPEVLFNDVHNSSGFGYGILGLAKPSTENESVAWVARNHGLINKAAYSIIIQNLDGSDGNLIIGGYDAAKIDGEINWTSIKDSNIHALLSQVEINGETIPVNRNYTLDTGGGNGYLPEDAYNRVVANLPEDPDFGSDHSYIRCSLLEGKTFTYNLNGIDYKFPLRSLYAPGESYGYCHLALYKGDVAQLGGSIFRNLFLAVDLEGDLFGLASLKNTAETDIKLF